MTDTLTNIQDDVRFWADDRKLTLTTGTNLRIANTIYQGMASPEYDFLGIRIGRRWPEFTREDTSLTMVVGQEEYNWPTSTVFKPPWFIEGLDTNASDEPYPIHPAPDMPVWSALDDSNNSRPLYYRLLDVSGTVKLALRPTPDQTDTIRITGLIEPTEFSDGSSQTAFLNKNADRALAMLIAAHFQAKWGDLTRARELAVMANGLLPMHDSSPPLKGRGYLQPWVL